MEQEIDQIILRTIILYGYDAIPMDYLFLEKYHLMDFYFLGVNLTMQGRRTKTYDKMLRSLCHPYVIKIDFPLLSKLYAERGRRGVMSLLNKNKMYFKILKSEITK